MKHWSETARVLSLAGLEAEAGRRASIATVIRIRGSAYRRPGAKLLIREDGTTSGAVSGGCLEADVREVGLLVLREGKPRLLHYDTGSDDRNVFGLGLGCNGSVDVFLQPTAPPEWSPVARRVRDLLAGEEPFAVSTVLEGEAVGRSTVVTGAGARTGSSGRPALDDALAAGGLDLLRCGQTAVHEIAACSVFTEVLTPPPRLVVFGAGDDALPLVHFALAAGLRASVVDHRPAFLAADRFPAEVGRFVLRPEDGVASLALSRASLAVVKTHSLEKDREWVRRLLGTPVAYVGVLGPRARTQEILRQAEAAADERVFGPVGLDLGGEGPEQVALSIVGELLAVWSGRPAGHLRHREGPIHGR